MLHQLGSGVLGPVFRAHDAAHDRILAIKALKLDLIPEDAARLAGALGDLAGTAPRHPSLVDVLAVGLEGSTPFVVSTFAPGETLDVVMRGGGPVKPGEALPLLDQIAGALDAAWAAGVGHGMLHPRDVFVEPATGAVHVTGVGLAPALAAVGLRPPVRRPYMAPERLAGETPTAASDVYALGAIAHELLTGRRPVGPGEQDGTFAPGLTAVQRAALRKVLAGALAADPARRPETCGALVDALRTAVDGGQPILPAIGESDPHAHGAVPEMLVDDAPAPERTAGHAPGAVPLAAASSMAPGDEDWIYRSDSEPAGIDAHDPPVAAAAASSRLPLSPPLPPSVSAAEPGRAWWRLGAMVAAGVAIGAASLIMFRADRQIGGATAVPSDTEVDLVVDPPVTTGSAAAGEPAAPPPVASEPAAPAPVAREPAAPPVEPPPAAHRVSAASGQLLVRSQPAGALVRIDGHLRGETPATVRDLPLGRVAVQIARPGYAPVTRQVTLTQEAPSLQVTVELQKGLEPAVLRQGAVYVDSRPRGARVTLDGRFVGTTPMRLPGVSAGRHLVRLALEGYRTVTAPVTVRGGAEARVAATLEPASGRAGGR